MKRLLLLVCVGMGLFLSAGDRPKADDDDLFLLRVRPGALSAVLARHGLLVVRSATLGGSDLHLVRCGPDDDDDDESQVSDCDDDDIEADPDVVAFEENDDLDVPEIPGTDPGADGGSLSDTLTDPSLVDHFGTHAWTQYVRQPASGLVRLTEAQTIATGAGIVAVIDTGADFDHPVLRPALLEGYDFIADRPTTTSELADLDPDTAGLINQSTAAILEQETILEVNQSTAAILEERGSQVDPGRLPSGFGHGTMVAGLVRLVAPGARILPLRAFGPSGRGSEFDILRAIYFAADRGARVINMSFSLLSSSAELERAIDYATARGAILVASAGNAGNEMVVYPAAYPTVAGVASTTAQDTRSSFSNYGVALVTVAAPGERLLTTYPGGNYAGVWGTSFSAALVSGTAALLVQADPGLDYSDAFESLSAAVPLDPTLGAGRLDIYGALVHRLND